MLRGPGECIEGLGIMGRPAVTNEGLAPHDTHGFDLPPERLRSGGGRQPAVVVVVAIAALALVLWQPWGSVDTVVGPIGSPASTSRAIVSATPMPSPTVDVSTVTAAVYTSITDNEWTVVALLAPRAVSTEEPATPHALGWSPTGPLLVLQQGVIPLATPAIRQADQRALCAAADVPRERRAVPLPAGRVVYVGITVPGAVPRATVTASIVGASPGAMRRAVSPTIELAGRDAGRGYIIPSSGPGGAILFAMTALAPLPTGTYRFEVASPGSLGHVYLYACVLP